MSIDVLARAQSAEETARKEFLHRKLHEIQNAHASWVSHNFGEQNEQHPFYGMVEETGELFHALLKLSQGIRVNEHHGEKIPDAIGDILIYMMNVCSLQKLRMSDLWPGLHVEPVFVGRRPLLRMVFYLGQIAGYFASGGRDTAQPGDRAMLVHALRAFLATLEAFCVENDMDMLAVLCETWAVVKKRDWTKNRETGKAPA